MSKTNPLKYAAVADLMEQHELMATAVEAHGVICGLVCGGVALAGWSLGPAGGRRSAASPAESEAQGQVDQHADHDGPEHAAAPEEPGRARRR